MRNAVVWRVGSLLIMISSLLEPASFAKERSTPDRTAGPAPSAAWTAESDQEGACFGLSVGSTGDVNGDEYPDIIVGSMSVGIEGGDTALRYGTPTRIRSLDFLSPVATYLAAIRPERGDPLRSSFLGDEP